MKVTKTVTFDAAHRLMAHQGKCRNLHGHTYKLEVTVEGGIDKETGMVIDFGTLKRALQDLVDTEQRPLDHATILHKDDPLVPILLEQGMVVLSVPYHPTAENMARMIAKRLTQILRYQDGVAVHKIRLWETPTSYAEWTDDV